MHVLIVKTSSIGDIIHTLPALTDAMQNISNIKFDWVVEEMFSQIPHWHPAVERVIPVAIRRWKKKWFCTVNRKERYAFKKDLQYRNYNAVIDAQGLIKSAALITRIAKGPLHGQNYRSAREPLASLFFNHRYFISKNIHAIERMRKLFALSLNYKQPNTQHDYAIVQRFLKRSPINYSHYLVFLHATTRYEKHWPEEYWRELIAFIEPMDIQIKLPWGMEHEKQRSLRLAYGFKHVQVLSHLSLEMIANVILGAKALISVDTGFSHLAAALNKPNITLYGPTNPLLIGTRGKHQIICCSPSNKMIELNPKIVINLLLSKKILIKK
ncbi:Lipopolysaccharide heptosyltransferase 1 [Candidatus Profftia lariciata]|uniref:lipopolysaccharide heptosyltransferase RfaC n=1 Tax=Candidatus Profftia lariciata TaxID=1987921 RepID=UPI001D02ACCB|nr:lipopolysaccharide heptosyltransferase RfaC [Candidatus Profftia lariciata]UDG81479.1 Lipopolysaccharide heptosyltransferase 1 [Candidatus Profftia lariciata]